MGVSMFTVLIVIIIALIVGICSSIASYVWLIYGIIVLIALAINIWIYYEDGVDEGLPFTGYTVLFLIFLAVIAQIIVEIGS